MQIFNLVDINLFTITILVVILVNVLKRGSLGLVQDRIYQWIVLSVIGGFPCSTREPGR